MMRQILMTILLGVSVTTEAKGISVKDSALILNKQVDVLMAELPKMTDSTAYYNLLVQIIQKAIDCDKYDAIPNKKGNVQPKFRAHNSQRLFPLRDKMLAKGLYITSMMNSTNLQYINFYLQTLASPLFQTRSKSAGYVAYEVCRKLYYTVKDYSLAEHFADIALADERYAERAAEIKIRCMQQQLYSCADSLKYLTALRALHQQSPAHDTYFYLLMDYYTSPGHENELENFANDEIRKDSLDTRAWTILGEVAMKRHDWRKAIASYVRVLAIDTAQVAVWYNVGICYSSQGQELKDELVDDRGRLTKDDRVEVRKVYDMARKYFVKASKLDPERKRVDWATPLYQAYYVLGEKDRAKRLEQDVMK